MDDFGDSKSNTSAEAIATREKAVKKARAILGKHFDCVLILASSSIGPDETGRVFDGFGNIYGQRGMAHEYLRCEYGQAPADV